MKNRPKFTFANLDEASLERMRELESQMENVCILAVQPRVTLADLTDEQVEKVRALEDELGVILLAYSDPPNG